MINAEFKFLDEKKTIELSIKGHAGAAEPGKDIICASASMLAYTLAQDVTDSFRSNALKKRPNITLVDGDAIISCTPKKEAYAEVLHTFFVIQKGFVLLEHNYPDYVSLKMFDC